ncbi:MAG: phage holin family protein [Chloroflexaceae bacterium]
MNSSQMREQALDPRRLILRWLISTLAIFAAVWLVPGIEFSGPGWELGIVAVVFGLLNALIRPLLVILTCPLILLTLGLFGLVINALLLALASELARGLGIKFYVYDFWAAFWGGLVISLVSLILSYLAGEQRVQIHVQRGNE